MSVQVLTEPPRPATAPRGESRIMIHGVGWEGYELLLKVIGDRPSPRLAYLNGDVELMSPGSTHETLGERFGWIIYEIAMGLELPCQPAGQTTYRRQDVERGIEGDETFYLANEARVRDNQEINLEVDPPPDLAIEVEITRPAANRLAIYAGLMVPEVWICDGQSLRFLRLSPEGSYDQVEMSEAIPGLTAADVLPWVHRPPRIAEMHWMRQLRDWVNDVLAPRIGRLDA